MITLCTRSAGGGVVASLTGAPMLRPAPVIPEFEPTPMMLLCEVTLCMPEGSGIRPLTRMT